MTTLTLISRTYCHLCHEMESALRGGSSEEFGFDIEVLDVDDDPDLVGLYDEKVPVLLHKGIELCRYHLDMPKVRDYLSKIG